MKNLFSVLRLCSCMLFLGMTSVKAAPFPSLFQGGLSVSAVFDEVYHYCEQMPWDSWRGALERSLHVYDQSRVVESNVHALVWPSYAVRPLEQAVLKLLQRSLSAACEELLRTQEQLALFSLSVLVAANRSHEVDVAPVMAESSYQELSEEAHCLFNLIECICEFISMMNTFEPLRQTKVSDLEGVVTSRDYEARKPAHWNRMMRAFLKLGRLHTGSDLERVYDLMALAHVRDDGVDLCRQIGALQQRIVEDELNLRTMRMLPGIDEESLAEQQSEIEECKRDLAAKIRQYGLWLDLNEM